ncbi:MAG: acylglycerol kinase family protein, partial [Planctomycetes bacterium]|nr:acylglycerol kinase family protein [Planctomycetota bacterium]
MRTRIAAIINPVSGRRDMLPTVQRIGAEIRRAGGTLDIFTTERLGHATVLASNLHVETEALLVVGGDGTVCEVVNGLAEDPIPLAILRTGTENLLARELRMP